MALSIPERIEAIRAGTNPTVICRVPSGWVVLCDMQFLRGYCILLADPLVPSLNDLGQAQRAQYLCDMALVGDALLFVTGAFRINYAIMGNSDPFLHAHIVPRYADEPEEYLHGLPWSYPKNVMDEKQFDYARDKALIHQLREAIELRTHSD
jgi:diadenosine tetraphosphate (Ap4A) HIT family hydrolase